MNILVTGASGFIGSRFVEMAKQFLKEEDQLVLLTSKKIEGYKCIIHQNYTFSSDAFTKADIERIDKVIHIGHFVHQGHLGDLVAKGNISSINSTIYMLEHLPNVPQKFVYCSTMDVYGINREEKVDEESSLCVENSYAASKVMIEMLLREWAKNNGVMLHILRLAHIYGPGDSREYTIPKWLKAEKLNESIKIFTNPHMFRNCLYLDDCCKGLWSAVYLEQKVEVINLVSKHNATMYEIAETCKEVSANKKEIEVEVNKDIGMCGLAFKNNNRYRIYLGEEIYSLKGGLEKEYNYLK